MKKIFLSNYKIITFLILILLCFYKSPYLFLNGRFIAEEGSFYFKNTFLHGFYYGLVQVYWESSYFNFWANLSSIISNFVPISYSPLVSVYFAFLVKIYLFIYIIFTDSYFLNNKYKKIICCFVVLASPPMAAEIWLNNLVSLVYFTIICILVFFQKFDKKNLLTLLSPFILLITSLSSIIACIFTPFYFFKLLKNKNSNNFYNFLSMFIGSCLQSYIFIYSKINNLQGIDNQLRFDISYDKLINFTYNVIIKSFFGREFTQKIYYSFFENINLLFLSIIILFLSILILMFILKEFKRDKVIIYLIIFFILQSILAIYGAKVDQVQGRYAVIPGALLIFIFLSLIDHPKIFVKSFATILIIFSLSTGLYEYKKNNAHPQLLLCIDCPNWKNEVSKWKNDKNHELRIWDYTVNKRFSLN